MEIHFSEAQTKIRQITILMQGQLQQEQIIYIYLKKNNNNLLYIYYT